MTCSAIAPNSLPIFAGLQSIFPSIINSLDHTHFFALLTSLSIAFLLKKGFILFSSISHQMPSLAAILLVATPVFFASVQANEFKVGDRLPAKSAPNNAYKTLTWDDLLPKGWDPMAGFKDLNLAKMDDADPRATEALEKLRLAWNVAPANPAINGKNIRIPGFIVSLDGGPNELREFLLVPYFGACIHVPPPPANQVIHVMPNKPVKGVKNMEAVWVTGKISIGMSDSEMGHSSYRMQAVSVTPYKK